MKTSLFATLIAIGLLVSSAVAHATDVSVEVRFGIDEVSIIRDYFDQQAGGNRKDRKHTVSLPPGIAKNLQRGKPLPPGISRQALPGALTARLPRVPDGYERVIVDGKVLLVEVATQVIHDVLTDVILH
jgi:hypothetical protein